MRIGVKILGVFLALFGVFLLTVFPFALGNSIKTSDNGSTLASCMLAVLGAGFIFAGRHFFQADPSSEDPTPPASSLSRFLVRHRRDLKVIAQVGFMLSLLRLVMACFGSDWPTRQATGFLLSGAFGLLYCSGKAANPAPPDNRDWMKVPTWIRRILEPAQHAVTGVWVGAVFLVIYAQWNPSGGQMSHFVTRIAFDAMLTFVYALTALFFHYGNLQPPST